MKRMHANFTMALLVVWCIGIGPLSAQTREETTVQSATGVLNEIMAIPNASIPRSMLADAQGLVIVPGVVKGGFVVGVRHGRGVALIRDQEGNWEAPVFLTLTGGSVGFQAGLQAIDVILVFKTPKSVQGLMGGKFTIGADAAAAAGPVGRQASAATDANLGAEIYSYSRTRGLFAGVSLDGSALQIDQAATQGYYQPVATTPGAPPTRAVPQSAIQLVEAVTRYTKMPDPAATAQPGAVVTTTPGGIQPGMSGAVPVSTPNSLTPSGQPTVAATGLQPLSTAPVTGSAPAAGQLAEGAAKQAALRQQLAASAQSMQPLLDDTWKKFLAIPAPIFAGGQPPTAAELNEVVSRFMTIQQNPQYAALAQRPEFQTTLRLLREYQAAMTANAGGPLQLPPPPGQGGASVNPAARY